MAEGVLGKTSEAAGWLTGLQFNVVGVAAAAQKTLSDAADVAAATKAGAGFTLSPDEARSLLERARRLRDNTIRMKTNAESLTMLTPPAQDPGSIGFNQQAVGTFAAGKDSNERMHDYMVELIGRLETAMGIVQESDGQAASDMARAGKTGPGSGIVG
ncbi:hypothetical protein [Amycolatopsis benzoatilytica]|uniref:hypothetical protein n=1 Tax=Amycolatopsis benzoatilytica TaxID=346045 RepID=UPI0012B6A406|nr:hypothetical protein [Amycolatopsis benzoatilytica]